ncbi:hypothetical protein QOT17_001041 [Balamuthia mandrillaris]
MTLLLQLQVERALDKKGKSGSQSQVLAQKDSTGGRTGSTNIVVKREKMWKNRTLPCKSTELIDSQEREQVLHRWMDLAMKERLRLGTLNGNRLWKPALQAVQKEAKIPECFVKGD